MLITNKPELLSPVGSMESLKAGVNNGCDAVYLGGKDFSARASAENFSVAEIEEACDYCHLRGVKVYVTVNTIYKESEIDEFLSFVGKLYKIGVDALIIQDLGAVKIVKENFPDFKIHASTQMTANSIQDVKNMQEVGFSKVVLSRELSLTEIGEIIQNSEVEIETFVHGALCVSYSGQCIMSSMLGGRSGNRGRCAQTCRLPYTLYQGVNPVKEGHLLSPKDVQTVAILPELIEAGIHSFKIEGRMKNPEYVGGVTGIYRKYIDMYFDDKDNYSVDNNDIKNLMELFNRGGFTEGYYHNYAGEDMISIERPKPWGLQIGFVDSYIPKINRVTIRTREPLVAGDGIEIWTQNSPHVGSGISKASKAGEVITVHVEGNIQKNDPVYRTYGKSLKDTIKKTWEKDRRKMSISGAVNAKFGEPLTLQLWDNDGNSIFVKGNDVEKAQNQPLSLEKLKEKISKMGATPFVLDELSINMDNDIYITVSDINELRRQGAEALEKAIVESSKKAEVATVERKQAEKKPFIKDKEVHVLVQEFYQLEAIADVEKLHTIYFEAWEDEEKYILEAIDLCKQNDVKLFIALSKVSRQWRKDIDTAWIDKLNEFDIDGFLVRSQGQFNQVKDFGKKIVVDMTTNTINKEAVTFWENQGADTVCLSVEANLEEINAMGNETSQMVVYGYLPLMKTSQCPVGNFIGEKNGNRFCSKKDSGEMYFLKDRKGIKFPLMTDCKNCYCTILNSQPLFTLKFYDEVLDSVTGSVRLDFTKEGAGKVRRITEAYCQMTSASPNVTAQTRSLLEEMQTKGNTKGHFFRGIE